MVALEVGHVSPPAEGVRVSETPPVQFVLRITIRWMRSAHREMRVVRELVFATEHSARDCQALMAEARAERGLSVEFVRKTPEQPL